MSRNVKACSALLQQLELCRGKHCQTLRSNGVFYPMKLKPEKERSFLILEYDYNYMIPKVILRNLD